MFDVQLLILKNYEQDKFHAQLIYIPYTEAVINSDFALPPLAWK